MEDHICDECGRLFSRANHLKRHKENVHTQKKRLECSKCKKKFGRLDNFMRHEKACNGDAQQTRTTILGKRKRKPSNPKDIPKYKIVKTATAFNNAAVTWKLKFSSEDINFMEDIEEGVNALKDKIVDAQTKFHSIKISMALHAIFEKASDNSIKTNPPAVIPTDQIEIYDDTNIDDVTDMVIRQITTGITLYEKQGSGFQLSSLADLDCTIWHLNALRGSSTFHSLPKWIRDKRAVINVQNKKDFACFKWSVLAALHNEELKHNRTKTFSYAKFDDGRYDFSMLTYPVALKDIHKFVKKNNFSINVFGVEKRSVREDEDEDEDGVIYPLKITGEEIPNRHINLLLTENKNGLYHYSTITNFSALLNKQYNKDKTKYYYCYTCLHGFKKKKGENMREECKLLTKHREYCKTLKSQRTEFPKGDDTILKFTDYHKQVKAPFVVYCDAECVLRKVEHDLDDVKTGIDEEPPKKKRKVDDAGPEKKETPYQVHEPASFAYLIVSVVPDYKHEIKMFKGENVVLDFLKSLQKDAKEIFEKYILKPKKMIITPEQEAEYQKSTTCHICEKEINPNDTENYKVRDHDHILSSFISSAHRNCNLNYNIKPNRWKLPCYFHNLKGYDGHLIIKALQKEHGNIRVIPTNMEKFLSITVGQLQFNDSMQFAPNALDQLAKTLKDDEFHHLRKEFPDEKQNELMKEKGIFAYDFFDDCVKFKYDKFPSREEFFNTLSDKECSQKDWERGKHVWDTFGCETFEAYHDIYLKQDVLLLADFFEKFRKQSLDNYGLDPSHFYSSPGLSWSACLKMTGVELELFDNEEMYTFMERSIRGGISMITKRFAKANNEGCVEFDPQKPISYMIYLDANNLYGWALSQFMPTGQFRWLSNDEIRNIPAILADDAEDGFIFEVDLEYPHELHKLHNSYPLAPERLTINESMLSPFQKEHFPGFKDGQVKLTPNLMNKTNYVVHYRNLKYYLEKGMKLTKIHRVLTFKQEPWIKKFIDFNTSHRAMAKSQFEKDYYKLINNSFFGKCLENLRNRVNVEVITDRNVALKRVAKPNFERSHIIREDLVIIQNKVTTLKLNKPLYVGFSVLDLSKLLMYQFHYEKMLKNYKDINLCFTDTDSLLYEVNYPETEKDPSIYKDMEGDDDFDFSDYPFEHPLYSTKWKKVIGKFKDELNGMTLEEFIGLRPKLYSMLYRGKVKNNIIVDMDEHSTQKGKGIKESVKIAHIRHSHFRTCLEELQTITVKQNILKSKKQTISSYHVKKVALTAFDTKRWILDDNVNTLAHGHYLTLM